MRLSHMTLKLICITLLTLTSAYALPSEKLINAKRAISDVEQVIENVKAKSHFPLLFPSKVPVTGFNEKLFANANVNPNGDYVINIDATPECDGAKFCNVGSVSARAGKHPQIYRTKNGKDLTKVITLKNGNTIHYTPAHAEADFWPSMVEWEEGNVLYNISWKIDQQGEQKTMLDMAETVEIY